MTSSSPHAHAQPLREGAMYCTHHAAVGAIKKPVSEGLMRLVESYGVNVR